MEDIVRPVGCEDALHMLAVGDARDYGPVLYLRVLFLHHQAYVVHRCLGLVDEDHLRRVELCHLAHHLGTYAAGRSGDKDALALQELADGVHIDLDFLPREEVLDGHLVQLLVGKGGVAAVPFFGRGHHHYLDAGGDEFVHHCGVVTEFVALEWRHEENLHAVAGKLPGEALAVEIDRLSHQIYALHLHAVGNECAERVFLVLHDIEALGEADAAGLGAVDDHRLGIVDVEGVVEPLDGNPFHPHQHRAEGEGHENCYVVRKPDCVLLRPKDTGQKTGKVECRRSHKRGQPHPLEVNE